MAAAAAAGRGCLFIAPVAGTSALAAAVALYDSCGAVTALRNASSQVLEQQRGQWRTTMDDKLAAVEQDLPV